MPLQFTAEQKFTAIVREIKKRERVYARIVAEGKMTQAKADYELQIMRAIATDYETLARKDRLL